MKIYITRHGQTIDNIAGRMQGQRHGKLSELGITQARLLGARLASEDFDVAFCSDRGRAVETVLPLLEYQKTLHVIYTPLLREKDIGSYVGLSVKECDEHDEKFGPYIDVESNDEFQMRADKFWEMVQLENQGIQKVLIVAHAAINRRVMAAILGVSKDNLKSLPYQSNAALTILDDSSGKWEIIVENEVEYLGEYGSNNEIAKVV